ncbi:glutathione S-transferase C-terminal-like protein [Pisolithus croceorrhizus]|nr:glutathione S-transferase C-terminal-like protein [Pisolithus croceorrhizus]
MAVIGKLWGYQAQRQTKVILAVAAVSGLDIDMPHFEFMVTNRTPEFLENFPLGKIPAFEDATGFALVEGIAIARHVCSLAPESGLLGRDPRERALVDQWVQFCELEIMTFNMEIRALHSGRLGPYSKELFEGLINRQARSLKYLETYLASCSSGLLVGNQITLADVALAASTEHIGRVTCGAAERALYPNIFVHYEKVVSIPGMKEVFGEPEFVQERLAYKESQ